MAAKTELKFFGGYAVYSESGVDLTLLRENLRHSVGERWANHVRGVQRTAAFREIGLAKRGNLRPTTKDSIMFDPQPILRRLLEQNVEFVVIGGLAMVAQGSAYITYDLDICYQRTPTNIAALTAALGPLHPNLRGAPEGLPFRFDAPTIQSGLNFTLQTDLGPVDVLGEVAGVGSYDQVVTQSDEETVCGLTVRVLSLDGLIAAKRASGRDKDKLHLLELEELKKLRDAGT